MTFDAIIQSIVTLVGLLLSFGYYPQAYHMWRKRSAGGVSLASYSIFVLGTTVWTLYGFYRHDVTIILSFLFGMIGSWLVLGLTLYFQHKKDT